MQLMKITGHMISPYIIPTSQNSLNLDSILAYAVAAEDGLEHLPMQSIKIPIESVWNHQYGDTQLHLWNCSSFRPRGAMVTSDVFYTKRFLPTMVDVVEKPNVFRKGGKWKSTYAHLPACHAERIEATASGDPCKVRSLLETISHVGAKGSLGYGRVAKWSVTETTESDHLNLRALPIQATEELKLNTDNMIFSPRCGWTPPYWKVQWHLPCFIPSH